MKLLIVSLISIWMVGCGKKTEAVPETPTCEAQAGAAQITYADGLTRKSNVTNCTYSTGKKCIYASFVNDYTITFTDCN